MQISKAVTSIGNYAFGSCSNLAGITILNPDCQIDDNQFGEWKVRTPAKCEKTGVDYHICLVCQHEETRTTEKLGHDYATAWTVDTPAKCATQGSKSHHCTRCDAIADVTEIPATGAHTYVDGICKDCGKVKPPFIPGVVTGEGEKPAKKDLLRLQKYLAGWDVEINEVAADCNGDGQISKADLLRLQKYLAGWDVTLGE